MYSLLLLIINQKIKHVLMQMQLFKLISSQGLIFLPAFIV